MPRSRSHPSGSPPGPITPPSLLRMDGDSPGQGPGGWGGGGGRAQLVPSRPAGRAPAQARWHRRKDLVMGRHCVRGRGHQGLGFLWSGFRGGVATGRWAEGGPPRVGCAGYCLPVSPSSQPRLSPSRKCQGPPARPPHASGNPLPIRSEGRNVPLPQAQACLPQGPHQPSLTRPSPWPGTAGRSGLLGGGVLSLLEARPERRLAGEDSGQGLISSRVGGGGDGGQVEA